MNDLEDRLRAGLHDLADTVPASPRARADLAVLLARRRRWRAPALATAAAAAVVLAIAVIPAADRGTTAAGDGTTTPPLTLSTPVPPTDTVGSGTENDPWRLARVTEGGVEKDAVLWVTADNEHCMRWRAVDPANQPALPGPECDPLPATWPTGPPGQETLDVLQTGVLSDYLARTGPLQHLMVFITAPYVERLDVRRGDGSPASVRVLGRDGAGVTFHLVDFGPPPNTAAGFGWTAWDALGNVVESAIT
jgi:hypothetical protein